MNLYISVDIEGATGLVSFSQCGRADLEHYDYPFARRMLTEDLNAVIRGAREGGAERVLLKDAHGNCKNLLSEELEAGTELVIGLGPVRDGMMDGIDESFGAAMLIGYHGMAGRTPAMMDHALVGGLHRLWINGIEAGEILVSAAVAGEYGVPLVMVSSDDEGCAEARESIPGVSAVSTKTGIGKYMGRAATPSETLRDLRATAREAMLGAKSVVPVTFGRPIRVKVAFRTTEEAEAGATRPGITRTDGYTLEWEAESFLEAHRIAVDAFQLSILGRRIGSS